MYRNVNIKTKSGMRLILYTAFVYLSNYCRMLIPKFLYLVSIVQAFSQKSNRVKNFYIIKSITYYITIIFLNF